MNDINEPADRGYVAVKVPDGVLVLCRIDKWAPEFNGKNWFHRSVSEPARPAPLTWVEVCRLGPIAYVGEFVDRRTT